jgi:heptosyltransferase-3
LAEFKDIKKILVIKLRHIGDVLLTIPAIRALRDTFPSAAITALVNSGTEDALKGNPLIHEILTLDRSALKQSLFERIKYEFCFAKQLRKQSFDMAVDLTGGDRPALYSFLSRARYRIGYEQTGGFTGKRFLYTHRFNIDGDRHTVLQNLELLNKAGIETNDLKVDFYIPKQDEDWLNNVLIQRGIQEEDIIIHIHPTSRWLFKCWKDEYMAILIDRVQEEYGANVIITCSSDTREMDKANKIIALTKNKPIAFIGDISLKKLGAISKRAKLFFGVDSAPMHIAAALGTPVVALFGPSGAFHWGPWENNYGQESGVRGMPLQAVSRGQKSKATPYEKKNGVQTFGKHTVIQRDWDCIPCGKDGCDGSKISDCLDDIGVDEVMGIVGKYLGGPPIETPDRGIRGQAFGDRSR